MKIHRFYISPGAYPTTEKPLITEEKLVLQLSRVLKLRTGEYIDLFDGLGRVERFEIQSISKEGVSLQHREALPQLTPKKNAAVAFSIVKKDTTEWIVQKCVELGVSHVYPCITERSEKKGLSFERLSRIVIEAVEQSGWGTIPEVHTIQPMMNVISHFEGLKYICSATGERVGIYPNSDTPFLLCIGPEGGFTEKELGEAQKNGCTAVSLGEQTLRAETAVVAALSLFLLG